MKSLISFAVVSLSLLAACERYSYTEYLDGGGLGGAQSPIGEVGNKFQLSGITGLSGVECKITELKDGISTIYYTCKIENQTWLDMAKSIPGSTFNGNTIVSGGKAKITKEGIENEYDEGKLLLVNYNTAKVGDKYSLDTGSRKLEREVVAKSTDDDFFWGWMMIKTIDVEETGRGIPGVSKVTYHTNHKFGLVGMKVQFEDGSTKSVGIYSDNTNE